MPTEFKEFSFNGGSFKMSIPNVLEGLRLESKIRKGFPEPEEGEEFVLTGPDLLALTIENMSGHIREIKIEEKDASYEDLLAYRPAKNAIIEAGDEMVGEIFLGEKKRDS